MREVGLSDLSHAARAVLSVPPSQRSALCEGMLWRAHVADKYVKRLGKLHPEWGDGSLRGIAIRSHLKGHAPRGTDAFCIGLQVVLAALVERQSAQKGRLSDTVGLHVARLC